MKYAVAFALFVAGATLAATRADSSAVRVAFGAAAIAFAIVMVAYATQRPGLLGKRSDGSRRAIAWPILWPYFAMTRASLALYRLSRRGDVALAELAPGIWFGQRPRRASQTPTWAGVLDLAAEFPRARVASLAYRSLPLLDGQPIDARTLEDAVAWIDEHRARGPVLVHCALGHGRTGSVVVAWMLAHSLERDVAAAVAQLRALRPTFGLSAAQAAAVERFAAKLSR